MPEGTILPSLLCIPTKESALDLVVLNSNTRIILQIHLSRRISIPRRTHVFESRRIRHTNRNICLTLHKLHRQALTRMPCNMAMQEPRARIVFLESDCEVAICGERGDVSTRWIDEIQCAGI